MEPIMPKKIRKEQDTLFEAFMKSDEDISPMEYMCKYGSDDLRKYLIEKNVRRKKTLKMGLLLIKALIYGPGVFLLPQGGKG